MNKIGTIECIEKVDQAGGIDFEETFSLGLPDVGGIFILHAIASALAVLIAIVEFERRPQNGRRKFTSLGTVFFGKKKKDNSNAPAPAAPAVDATTDLTPSGSELPFRASFAAQKH